MKKILIFFGLLALLVSCSTIVSRYVLFSGFSYTEGMEEENWRIKVLLSGHGFEEVVINKEVNDLVLRGGYFVGKINLNTDEYRFLISIMQSDRVRYFFDNGILDWGVTFSFLDPVEAESLLSSLNNS